MSKKVQHILFSAPNASGFGGIAVVKNIIMAACQLYPDWKFSAILPVDTRYDSLKNIPNLNIHWTSPYFLRYLALFYEFFVEVPNIIKKIKPDICFSLGDIGPLSIKIPHFVLMHNPLINYYKTEHYQKHILPPFDLANKYKFAYNFWHFQQMVPDIATAFVQTPVMAEVTCQAFGMPPEKVISVPMAPPDYVISGLDTYEPFAPIASHPAKLKLLVLSNIVPYKNHGILPDVCQVLKERGLENSVHIFYTASASHGMGVNNLLARLAPYASQCTNLGYISGSLVPGAIKSSSALLLPTLLESFGLPYVEGLYLGKPILTANLDFARWMCGKGALYFDPFSANDIVDVIEKLAGFSQAELDTLIQLGTEHLQVFPKNWTEVVKKYFYCIEAVLQKSGPGVKS